VLTYHRRKTGAKVQVQVEPCMQDIIRRYDTPSSPYVFPILRDGATAEETALRYSSALGYQNRLLKGIGPPGGPAASAHHLRGAPLVGQRGLQGTA
jgi:hypothetical protein